MARRTFRQVISEMSGKQTDSWFTRQVSGLFTSAQSVDYTRNDYDLYQAIYWASEMPTPGKRKVGKEYILAAALAKPIINSATAFIVGNGFGVELESEFHTPDQIEAANKVLTEWLDDNKHNQLDLVKFGLRDGDSYLYVGDDLNAEMLDPRTVEVIFDALSGTLNGFDVTEEVKELDAKANTQAVKYVKRYRKTRTDIYRLEHNEEIGTANLWYSEVYTTEGKVVLNSYGVIPDGSEPDEEGNISIAGEVIERPLPVVAFHNEPEPKAVYGNSELQNVLVHFKNYTAVLAEATKNVIYNGSPIPVIKGASKDQKASMQDPEASGDDAGKIGWGSDMILFLEGEKADAKFLSTGKVMDDAGTLIEYYFYLILQGSETPEFVFGAAVSSSKASVSEQMPVVVMKSDRKRTQLTLSAKLLVEIVIDRSIQMSNPDMLPFDGFKPKVKIQFPDIVDEDKNLTKDFIEMLLTQGIISNKTALKLSLGDKIGNLDDELANAKKDRDEAVSVSNILPDNQNDLNTEGDTELDDNGNPIQ